MLRSLLSRSSYEPGEDVGFAGSLRVRVGIAILGLLASLNVTATILILTHG